MSSNLFHVLYVFQDTRIWSGSSPGFTCFTLDRLAKGTARKGSGRTCFDSCLLHKVTVCLLKRPASLESSYCLCMPAAKPFMFTGQVKTHLFSQMLCWSDLSVPTLQASYCGKKISLPLLKLKPTHSLSSSGDPWPLILRFAWGYNQKDSFRRGGTLEDDRHRRLQNINVKKNRTK